MSKCIFFLVQDVCPMLMCPRDDGMGLPLLVSLNNFSFYSNA